MKNFFDSAAQDWDKNQMHINRTAAVANELENIIEYTENLKAMEFGAGTGLLSIALQNLFSEVTLMDSSAEIIRVTIEKLKKENISKLSPILFDLEKNDYIEKIFDVIITQMTLHHVIDVENIISKFYSLLNNGGQLAIADLYKEDGSFHDTEFKGHHGFNPEDLKAILSKVGFKDINYKQCFEITKAENENVIKTYPVFLLSCKK